MPTAETTLPHARQHFGDYELLEEIARGGMGVVYKARQLSLNRVVAVKMILAGQFAGKQFIQRFRTEAAAAALLQHPNIVAVHDVGVQDGQHFFSMEYVQGQNLAQFVGNRPLSPEKGARYVRQIAESIHYAHGQGIFHRDLKPSNVLIDAATDQPRITDFGLAKRVANSELGTQNVEVTLTGQILGSPNFMPPEQAGSGRGKVGRYSDVYSLGGILYYLLTARAPFQANSLEAIVTQVLHTNPVSPRLLNPAVPRDLDTICLKCLEKDPIRRYATARALAEELDRFLNGEPVRARPLGPIGKAWRWCERRPALASVLLLLQLALTVGFAGILWQWRRAEHGEFSARQNLYAADMNLAHVAVENGNLGRALELLRKHAPRLRKETDLRGWEWRYLWQHCQSDALSTICQKSNIIYSLAVCHEGRLLAIGEDRGALSIWDLQNRREVTRLSAGQKDVIAAFSPRDPLLAYSTISGLESTNRHYSVRLWDNATKQQLAELKLFGECRGLAFSADGQALITSSARPENQIAVWRIRGGTKLATYSAPQIADNMGNPFAVSREFSIVAHGMPGGGIRVVNMATAKELWRTETDGEEVTALAFSPDVRILASAAGVRASPIRLWDVASGKEIGHLDGHRSWIRNLVFWGDGNTLASGSADQTIRLWNITTRSVMSTLRGHRQEVWSLALLPNNRMLLSGSKDGSVCIWDTAANPQDEAGVTMPDKIATWRFGSDSKLIIALDPHGRLARWEGTNFRDRRPLMEIGTNSMRVHLSRDGQLAAAAFTNGTIQIWDLSRRTLLRELAAPRTALPVEFVGSGRKLIVACEEQRTLHEWDLDTGQETQSWRGIADQALNYMGGFSPRERHWLSLGYDGTCHLTDIITGRETKRFLQGTRGAVDASFSPDGTLFATASQWGFASLLKTDGLSEVARLRGFLLGVHSVAFSPDGKRLATGSTGNEAIKLWDVDGHQELLTLKAEGAVFRQSAFSKDGKWLGAVNHQGVLHLWRAPSFAEIESAEKAATAIESR
ncbi:MAG: protein kinase [Verrucomicrobiales bacterium]|nr:protein kinase [Verrucomicrobiales bacterium]